MSRNRVSINTIVSDRVRKAVGGWPPQPDPVQMNELLRLLGRWRSQLLANTYRAREGSKIWSGPFKGMDYVEDQTEGALIPRLLGCYECELHPHIERLAAGNLDCVIDVGCAEGYYAVGLARLMPQVTVYAHDINPAAREACARLAAANGVAGRVIVGGEVKPDGFQVYAGRRALVMVDAEGAETDILQPELSPALAGMNIIVETHDLYRPGTLELLKSRFAPTHEIVRVDTGPKTVALPTWLTDLGHLDQLLAVWEWRALPTPWLVMTPKG
jgi:hypothetical protein